MILGIDEVGRGPLAGPLVVGAVVLGEAKIEGLTDSKKLSKKQREELDKTIRQNATAIGLGWVFPDEIDTFGLSAALRKATIDAVSQIKVPYHEIIIDGTVNFLKDTNKGPYVTIIKKADLLIPSVSAASIVAKVARDTYMEEQDKNYPEYNFKQNVGYGTRRHMEALSLHGTTPLHRRSFAPVSEYEAKVGIETSKEIGDEAEDIVAAYLTRHGHVLLERNWRTKVCEIDIVSRKDGIVYFTEVKYRKTAKHGDGIAAITPKKLRKMTFAAELYMVKQRGETLQPRLVVIGIDAAHNLTYLEIE